MLRRALCLSLALLGACTLRCNSTVGAEAVLGGVQRLGEKVDVVKSVVCNGSLKAEVGARTTCSVTFADGSTHPVIVTVASLETDKDTAYFDSVWKTVPLGATNRTVLQKAIGDQVGEPVDLICPDGVIEMPVDKHLTCQVRGARHTVPIDIWANADGDFQWQTGGGATTPP
jgi:hypothetical protein